MKCDSTGANNTSTGIRGGNPGDVPWTASTTAFCRLYFRFDNLPGSTVELVGLNVTSNIGVKLTSGGKLQLWNFSAGTQIGSDSAATIVADATTWYRVELSATFNGVVQITACELQLDGVSVASTSGLTIAVTLSTLALVYGWIEAPGANSVLWIDDCAINDSSGAAQTSWPGSGNVVLLVPTATSAAGTGWRLGTNTAEGGNGWNSVNNEPPVGVADLAVGSDPKQIRNATANANDSFDTTMTTYTAAGVTSGATINVVTPLILTAAPVATSAKTGTVGVVSNPAIANIDLSDIGTANAFWQGNAAGTYTAGWKWSQGTITHAPSVTLGTAPVMRVTQVTSSTRIAMVCFMGMYVDYTPAAATGVAPPERVVLQAVTRSTVW